MPSPATQVGLYCSRRDLLPPQDRYRLRESGPMPRSTLCPLARGLECAGRPFKRFEDTGDNTVRFVEPDSVPRIRNQLESAYGHARCGGPPLVDAREDILLTPNERCRDVRTSGRVPLPRRKETAGRGYVVPIALAERVVGSKELLLPPSPDLGDEDPQEEGDDEGDVQEQQGNRSVEQEERGVQRMANPRVRTVRHKLVVGPNFDLHDHEPSERPDALTP